MPNHSRPHSTIAGTSRLPGSGSCLMATMAPTTRRHSVSAPGDRSRPAERIPTKAEAQSPTVSRAAARARTSSRRAVRTRARYVGEASMPVETPRGAQTGHGLARRRSGACAPPHADDLAHGRLAVRDPRVQRPYGEVEAAGLDLLELGHERVEPPPLLVDLDDVARPDALRAAALRGGLRRRGEKGRLAHRGPTLAPRPDSGRRARHSELMQLPVMPPVEPMLAAPVAGIPAGHYYEPKWDGFRSIVFRDGDEVEIGSRNGRPMARYFPDVVAAVKGSLPARCVVAGYRPHKSGSDAVGSLLLGLYIDDTAPASPWSDRLGGLAPVGVVGAFPMARRRELFAELQPLVCSFDEHPWQWAAHEAGARGRTGNGSRWNPDKSLSFVPLRPERVVEVRYDHMEGPRFRHPPQFVRWRPDRDAASCGYAQLERPVRFDLAEVLGAR